MKKLIPIYIIIGLIFIVVIFNIITKEKTIEILSTDIKQIDFEKQWETIRNSLELNQDSRLNNILIEFDSSDLRVYIFSLDIVERKGDKYISYKINFDNKTQGFNIDSREIDEFPYFDNIIEAKYFFTVINDLDRNYVIPDGDYDSYSISGVNKTGKVSRNYNFRYLIKESKVVEFTDKLKDVNSIIVDGWDGYNHNSSRYKLYFFH